MTTVAVIGYLGTDELAGAAFANIVLSMTTTAVSNGFGDSLITVTAQAIGAGRPKMAGVWLQVAALCLCVASVPIAAIYWSTDSLLALTGKSGPGDEVLRLAGTFARWSILGIVPDCLSLAFYQWLMGLKLAHVPVPLHVAAIVLNVPLCYFFVFGVGPWAGLGFIGAPIAMALSKTIRGASIVFYFCRVRKLHEEFWMPVEASSFAWSNIKAYMELALPGIATCLVEQSQFVIVTVLIGTLGPVSLAAHSGMLNLFQVMSSAMFGLTDAGAAIVGHTLGEGRPKSARLTSYLLLLWMLAFAVAVAAFFIGMQGRIGYLFSHDPRVVRLAGKLSNILGVGYIFLSVAFAAFGILQGQGRPTIAMVSMILGLFGVGLPLSYIFGFVWPFGRWGLVGMWYGLVTGYLTMTLVMVAFVATSPWSKLCAEAQERSGTKVTIVTSERLMPTGRK